MPQAGERLRLLAIEPIKGNVNERQEKQRTAKIKTSAVVLLVVEHRSPLSILAKKRNRA